MNAIQALRQIARQRMKNSHDPIHDLAHVERVVSYCKQIAKNYTLTDKQHQALILAAWWHDMGRTITKKPSFMFMSLVDDWISALMLWMYTIRFGLFGSVVGMSTRIIFCKGMGASALFSKILLRKKEIILLDILKDADTIDMLHADRTEQLRLLVASSQISRWGYKFVIKWFLRTKKISLKTPAAKVLLMSVLESFLLWISRDDIFDWHLTLFTREWLHARIRETTYFLSTLQNQYITVS